MFRGTPRRQSASAVIAVTSLGEYRLFLLSKHLTRYNKGIINLAIRRLDLISISDGRTVLREKKYDSSESSMLSIAVILILVRINENCSNFTQQLSSYHNVHAPRRKLKVSSCVAISRDPDLVFS